MKTAEEIARENGLRYSPTNTFEEVLECSEEYANQYKPKRISLEEQTPICYGEGNWDGKRSDYIVVWGKDGVPRTATAYEGILDGSEFLDFYEAGYDIEICDVKYWMYLPD